jgi:multiple sugar transport system substrate-binding protein
MRRAWILGLLAAFLFVMAGSGGEPAYAQAKKRLSVMYMRHWVPAADDAVQKRAEEWGAKNGVDIQFDKIAEKDFDFKITTAVQNKTGPDLVMFRSSTPILFQDALADVSDIAKGLIAKHGEFYPANKAQTFTGQAWVAIPWYTIFPTWMYRIDLLNKANVKVPDTYEEVPTVAKAVANPTQGLYGMGAALSRSRDGILFTQSVLWAFGMKMASEDGKTITFNSPETLAGLKYIVDLAKVMPPGVTGWDDSSNNTAWLAGKLAMTTNAPSIYYQTKTQNPELAANTGHAIWPKGPAGRPVMMDTYSLSIMKFSPNQDAAKELLRYLTTDEGYTNFYIAGQGFQCPTLPTFAKLSVFGDPKLKPVIETLPFGRTSGWPGPVTRGAAEVEAQGVMTDMVQRVLVDKLTPEKALDEATGRMKAIYAK